MKVFIDCGYYVGKALDYYAPLMDETWEVYAFEPYPLPNLDFSRFPFEVRLVQKAVWVEDGTVEFAVAGREDANHIDSLRLNADAKVPVISVDFSRFVSQFPEDATIVVSMDIEGAEFPVLEKMLADDTAKRITLLDIEFHHRNVENHTQEDASLLRRALEGEGVLVKTKVDI